MKHTTRAVSPTGRPGRRAEQSLPARCARPDRLGGRKLRDRPGRERSTCR